jgi:hypothetical protein
MWCEEAVTMVTIDTSIETTQITQIQYVYVLVGKQPQMESGKGLLSHPLH